MNFASYDFLPPLARISALVNSRGRILTPSSGSPTIAYFTFFSILSFPVYRLSWSLSEAPLLPGLHPKCFPRALPGGVPLESVFLGSGVPIVLSGPDTPPASSEPSFPDPLDQALRESLECWLNLSILQTDTHKLTMHSSASLPQPLPSSLSLHSPLQLKCVSSLHH